MKTLAVIQKDLEFYRGFASLIEALKAISVAQYRMLEHKIKAFSVLLSTIEGFFEDIRLPELQHPFFKREAQAPLAVVAVTSDSGLLGGLNMQVVTTALEELKKIPGKLIVVGERGKVYAHESGVPFVAFPGIKDDERHAQAIQVRDYLMDKVQEGAFRSLKVVYPVSISFTVQRIEQVSVLPWAASFKKNPSLPVCDLSDFILESSLEEMAEYLVYLWTGQKLYEIFGLSRLAEFAARFVHLERSHHKIKELDAKLKLEYFRTRHELIDRNMRELFSARLLYAAQSK